MDAADSVGDGALWRMANVLRCVGQGGYCGTEGSSESLLQCLFNGSSAGATHRIPRIDRPLDVYRLD